MEIPIIEEQWKLLEGCNFKPSAEIQQKVDDLGDKIDLLSENNELIGEKLTNIIESWTKDIKLLDIKYSNLEEFSLTFSGIENFSIKLYAKSFSPYTIKIETKDFDFQITDTDCEITCEKVMKDYKSFSSVAKSRFRYMANELGYEQITGITYVKERDGWYETFNLQSLMCQPHIILINQISIFKV